MPIKMNIKMNNFILLDDIKFKYRIINHKLN